MKRSRVLFNLAFVALLFACIVTLSHAQEEDNVYNDKSTPYVEEPKFKYGYTMPAVYKPNNQRFITNAGSSGLMSKFNSETLDYAKRFRSQKRRLDLMRGSMLSRYVPEFNPAISSNIQYPMGLKFPADYNWNRPLPLGFDPKLPFTTASSIGAAPPSDGISANSGVNILNANYRHAASQHGFSGAAFPESPQSASFYSSFPYSYTDAFLQFDGVGNARKTAPYNQMSMAAAFPYSRENFGAGAAAAGNYARSTLAYNFHGESPDFYNGVSSPAMPGTAGMPSGPSAAPAFGGAQNAHMSPTTGGAASEHPAQDMAFFESQAWY